MRGPNTARRSLFPFALVLGALALVLYVVAYLLGGSCDLAISPYIPFGAGGLCMAVAVTLGLVPGYRQRRRESYVLHWNPDEDLLSEFHRAPGGLTPEQIDDLRRFYGAKVVDEWLSSARHRGLIAEGAGENGGARLMITTSGERRIEELFPPCIEVGLPQRGERIWDRWRRR